MAVRFKYENLKRLFRAGWLAAACLFFLAGAASADDGYRLWLRYDKLTANEISKYAPRLRALLVSGDSPTLAAAKQELSNGLAGLLGESILQADKVIDDTLIVGTSRSSPSIVGLRSVLHLDPLGNDGFVIKSVVLNGKRAIVIAANTDVGALYGSFYFLRLLQTGQSIDRLNIT